MKPLLASVLLLLCISLSASSQPLRQWGVKLGPGVSSTTWEVSGTADRALQSRVGVDAAVYAEWLNAPSFSIVSEVHYLQQGFRAEDPMISRGVLSLLSSTIVNHYHYNVRLDYLSLAVLPKVRLESENIDYYALAGLHLDVALSHAVSVEGQGALGGFYQWDMDRLAGDFRKTLLGVTLGLGVELKSLLPLATGLEVRYRPNLQATYATDPYAITSKSFEFLITLSR